MDMEKRRSGEAEERRSGEEEKGIWRSGYGGDGIVKTRKE